MKYLDEYRSRQVCEHRIAQIQQTVSTERTIMEVCGGQTHGLLSHGIDQRLCGQVRLIHGPGCPVCVTPAQDIDFALQLAARDDVILTSFGDMLRVPGSSRSLLQAKAEGADVRIVISPSDAALLAQQHPERHVVFFAVGFETTTPATALAIAQAQAWALQNFSLIVSHVRVLPAMEAVMRDSQTRVEGFLGAGHVCTVDGFEQYHEFAQRFRCPVVIAGFEPADLLEGILHCVRQIERGEARVENAYARSARTTGNPHAKALVQQFYEVCDQRWRGLGFLPAGGLRLRSQWRQFCARHRFDEPLSVVETDNRCRSGEVLSGRLRPTECECFGRECLPESPLGAPMVSSEGACAAYYRFRRNRA